MFSAETKRTSSTVSHPLFLFIHWPFDTWLAGIVTIYHTELGDGIG